mgnify:CR=1 FL=1
MRVCAKLLPQCAYSAPLRVAATAVPFKVSACSLRWASHRRPHSSFVKGPYFLGSTRPRLLMLGSRTLLAKYSQARACHRIKCRPKLRSWGCAIRCQKSCQLCAWLWLRGASACWPPGAIYK